MAKELVTRCDVCGEPGARSWKIQTDGQVWEVDLDDEHAAPILAVAQKGHSVTNFAPPGKRGMASLESRVRGVPQLRAQD